MSGEVKFNGPPPPTTKGGRNTPSSVVRVALEANPGEWASYEADTKNRATGMRNYLTGLGYEAAVRGFTLYARKPL